MTAISNLTSNSLKLILNRQTSDISKIENLNVETYESQSGRQILVAGNPVFRLYSSGV